MIHRLRNAFHCYYTIWTKWYLQRYASSHSYQYENEVSIQRNQDNLHVSEGIKDDQHDVGQEINHTEIAKLHASRKYASYHCSNKYRRQRISSGQWKNA